MISTYEGQLDGSNLHLGIAVASWNQTVTDRLLRGALDRCEVLGVARVTVVRVPGALELPVAARALVTKGCDCVVAIGAIVRGDTDHYEIVVRESTGGVAALALESGVPVANAILAVHEFEHAVERSEPGPANKGAEAVDAAILTATALAGLEDL